jgi:hypothetical protein
MTLSTVNTTDTFEAWRQKDNLAIALLNTHDTAIAAIQASLSAPSSLTYYVATTGNDSNPGTVGSPFLTLQAAIDKALASNVAKGVTISISVANGTYSAASVISGLQSGSTVSGSSWQTPLIITGSSSAVLTSANQEATLSIGPHAMVKVTGGITISASGSTGTRHGVAVASGGVFEQGNVTWGTCIGDHLSMSNKALVIHSSNYSITGGASRHIAAAFHSLLVSTALTVTLTGTPTFTTAFAESADGSMVLYSGHTFTGSATGPRFIAQRGGYIRTGTASLTYLPGTTSGTIATGGNYESLYTLGNLDGTTLGATTPAPATVTTLTVNSTLDVNGQQDMHNNNMKGIKAASMNGGVSTSGTTGAVTVNWSSGALINQSALTGAPTYTFTPPTNTNTWLTLMGGAAVNPYAFTWPGSVIWYGSAFTTTVANKAWIVRFFWDGTNYHAFAASQV